MKHMSIRKIDFIAAFEFLNRLTLRTLQSVADPTLGHFMSLLTNLLTETSNILADVLEYGSVSTTKLKTSSMHGFQNQADFSKRCGLYTNFRRKDNLTLKMLKNDNSLSACRNCCFFIMMYLFGGF